MPDQPGDSGAPAPDRGVYGISVAAELSGVAVQSLRLYERYGLLTPARSEGGTRRYSADDLARLQRINALVGDGVNLAGIARILSLEDDNAALSADNTDLRSTNRSLRSAAKAGGSARQGEPPQS
ncbi:MerR family transcriptional regulator [Mycobacterium helveticum]|uniref:Helix-turn-helix transcriptional regulator n=1 Tax=Mycobacterium helveticum TaxID=2592811 RepID=A0A557XEH2_9MYCO|nr:helix-turn-helix transcriptional regulator [Mycobacterium helveticum]TVS78337.1 helix-turn-helix transcriptional regulator [Mycobacterium helveticum]TVS83969.1 helix-turn-helix transcriptional regulator [Mycobacterium helveticum]